MNDLTHKQAQHYIRADLDGLLTPAQRLDLETHLRACEACRLDSESFSKLTSRLQNEFHSRWDEHDGSSINVMAKVHLRTRRIIMSNRVNWGLRVLRGVAVLVLLGFGLNFLFSQLQDQSLSAKGTPDNRMPAPTPTPAPESRLIAFTKEVDGNFEIYTVRADGNALTNLTNSPSRDDNPYWSPDGKRIAFNSDRDGIPQVYVMDADGSNVTRVTEGENANKLVGFYEGRNSGMGFSAWSPDGSKLLYMEMISPNVLPNLYMVDIAMKKQTPLTDNRYVTIPSWSLDGKHVAFISTGADPQAEITRLHIVNPDGSDLFEVTSSLPESVAITFNYDWLSDGQSLSFAAADTEGKSSFFYEVGLDGTLIERASDSSSERQVVYWRNGTTMTLTFLPDPSVIWLRSDGTQSELELCPGAKAQRDAAMPSSHGDWIFGAFCSSGEWMIYWANSDGTMMQKILSVPITSAEYTTLVDLAWSQDDRFAAFNITIAGDTEMYILDMEKILADPSTPPQKIDAGNVFAGRVSTAPTNRVDSLSWQPLAAELTKTEPTPEPEKTSSYDGLIAFTSEQDGNYDVYTMRADGSDLTNITNNPSQDYAPVWSPDHSKIAFASDRNGNIDIFTMNPDGSDLTQLTNNHGDDIFLAWSPDGKQMAYLAGGENGDLKQVMVMEADGSHRTPLMSGTGYYYFQGWSPDGKHILYVEPNFTNNGVYRDLNLHIASMDGTGAQEWDFANFELLRWEDAQHFLGIVRENESRAWSLYRLNMDGNLVVIASYSDPLAGSFEKAIVVESPGSLQWFALEGTSSPQATWNFADFCEAPAGVTQQVSLSISPSLQQAVAVLTCKDARWLYLVSADGKTVKQLGGPMESSSEILINWLADGKSAMMLDFQPNGSSASLYLLDLQKMQMDVNIQPILLTTEVVHPYESAPPSRIGN